MSIPGLDELVQVVKQASVGPFHVQAGTLLDEREEIVAEFATPEDAKALHALFTLKDELVGLLVAVPPMFAIGVAMTEQEKSNLADAFIALKEKVALFLSPEKN